MHKAWHLIWITQQPCVAETVCLSASDVPLASKLVAKPLRVSEANKQRGVGTGQ